MLIFSIDDTNNCTKGLPVCYFILPLRPQTKNQVINEETIIN